MSLRWASHEDIEKRPLGVRRQWRHLLLLYLPRIVVLAFVRPRDGMWRFHIPGEHMVAVTASGVTSVRLDGRDVPLGPRGLGVARLAGRLHWLEVDLPEGGILQDLRLLRRPD